MSNLNLNKVILAGRLCADPELKQTTSGIPVITFRLAVNRRYNGPDGKSITDFITVTAWRKTAEFIARYFRRGSAICVIGAMQNNNWVDQHGVKHDQNDVVADEVTFVDSKSRDTADGPASAQEGVSGPYIPDSYTAGPPPEIGADDDLPF